GDADAPVEHPPRWFVGPHKLLHRGSPLQDVPGGEPASSGGVAVVRAQAGGDFLHQLLHACQQPRPDLEELLHELLGLPRYWRRVRSGQPASHSAPLEGRVSRREIGAGGYSDGREAEEGV
ncbi:unnamed protein product, partial [Effrenium voratum]